MKTNKEKLVMQSIQGRIHSPVMRLPGYRIGFDGKPRIVPATGGITYNLRIGDSCMGLVGDHIEPAVSAKASDSMEDGAFNTFACVGNIAKVITGDGKGVTGRVTGIHGGIDHVMIDFKPEDLEKLNIEDKIMIKAFGTGLKIEGYDDVVCLNLDPNLLEKMDIKEVNGVLEVGVTHIVDAKLMGSGLGSSTMQNGDYDIMTHDEQANQDFQLDTLRFGDIVAIKDHYNAYGPDYREGSMTIGVIIHGDSWTSGHGPGVTVLLTSLEGQIKPVINPKANLINYFDYE